MPWYVHLLGVNHEATSLTAVKGVPGSNDNCGWGEATSQHLTHLVLLPCLRGGAALAVSHTAWWHFGVAGSPELPLSSSPSAGSPENQLVFRKTVLCLSGRGQSGGVDKKALCEERDGAEVGLSVWQEGLRPPASHQAPCGRRSRFPLLCLGLFRASSAWTQGLCKALPAF